MGLSTEQKAFIRDHSKRLQGSTDTVTLAKRLGVPWSDVVEFLASEPGRRKCPRYVVETLKLKRMELLWTEFHSRHAVAPARARKAIEAQRDLVSTELLKLTLEFGGPLTLEVDACGEGFQRMLEGKPVRKG